MYTALLKEFNNSQHMNKDCSFSSPSSLHALFASDLRGTGYNSIRFKELLKMPSEIASWMENTDQQTWYEIELYLLTLLLKRIQQIVAHAS